MTTISIDELAKIPYLDASTLRGRTLSTLTFHDAGDWHLWVPVGDTLIKIRGLPSEGFYYGREPESPADVRLQFLEFIAQRACWPSIVPIVLGLRNDFLNLSATLKKFDILFDVSHDHSVATSRLVATELEYLFALCRSIFDLLQEVIAAQWDNVQLLDASSKKKQLPRSFSRVVFDGNCARDEEALMSKFSLPRQLAAFYVRFAPFFQMLRSYRDKVIHGGTTMELVYVTERGFAVHSTTRPFSDFGVWNDEHRLPNDLCSLRPAIAHIVNETLRACEDYAQTIETIIQYPPPMVPGFNFYMRGYYTELLHRNAKILSECHWWDDMDAPSQAD